MKRAITIFTILLLCVTSLFAQAPEKFSYQAVVRNTNNSLVADAPVGVRVSILHGSAEGSAVYVETQTATTNANGLLIIEIGGGMVQQGTFADINWANGPFFLKTETDPNGGSSYTVTSTQQLLSVPYALYAKEAGNSFSGDYNDLKNLPQIPQVPSEISAFTNDVGYITKSDLPDPSKGGSTNDAGVVQTTACGEIDLCELANQVAQMRLAFLPAVTTSAVGNVTETAATCGGNVTAAGYSGVTGRGVCWGTEPNPTVEGSHISSGSGTGAFTCQLTSLAPSTTYYVRAYATNSIGTAYGAQVAFTTSAEEPQDICGTITLPYSENFENYTTSTTAATGIEPDCWSLVHPDVTLTDANRPQLYYKSSFAHSGNYSLKMYYRCVYAMPALSQDIPVNQVKLTMYLRQANASYRLEVGVWDDATGTFEPVQRIDNSTTNVEYVTCDFSTYTGSGNRIAFRNVLGSGNYAYSTNYLDDITLDTVFNGSVPVTLPTVTTSAVNDITENAATCGGTVTADGGAAVTVRGVCWATQPNPTVNGSHTSNGSGTGAFTSSITGLEQGTTYYVRAYATNSAGTAYGGEMTFTTQASTPAVNGQPCPGAETVTDIDGNVYNTVQIGEQCWMRENLRTTQYADGMPIRNDGETVSATEPYYYDNTSSSINLNKRGYLYNWPALMHGTSSSSANPSNVQGVCPTGWHVPSNVEWVQLTDYVGSVSDYVCGGNSGNIAKALASISGWNTSAVACAVGNDSMANNASGFSAVPAGYCNGASFYAVGDNCQFWSSTEYGGSNVRYFNLNSDGANASRNLGSKISGCSVRCLRGAGLNAPAVTTGEVSEVTPTTAVCGGAVTADGGVEVTERGVCWGTEPDPTVSGSHTGGGAGTGAFTCSIAGLSPFTTYYVRAYATNSLGTNYGETVMFLTADTCATITVPYTEDFESQTNSTTAATGVQPYCWKLEQEDVPMTAGTLPQLYYKSSFAHSGNYSLKMGNRCVYAMPALSADVPVNRLRLEMYLRQANAAYQLEVGVWDDETGTFEQVQRINNSTTGVMRVECDFSNYTGNGHRIAFRNVLGGSANYDYSYNYLDDITLDTVSGGVVSATLPTVTTSAVSDITETAATCGGMVTDDGYAAVTGRGVCWGTGHNPTVNGSHTSNGSGTGTFTSNITGLAANTTYYVRAYATNSEGTAYGEERSFTTAGANTCGTTITLPYSEDFEGYTNTTTVATGVQPDCWSVVYAYVPMTDATRPQLYYNSSFAHSGSYSLKMGDRCVYAMPALSADIPLSWVRLDMYLRQANDYYQLEVGVWEDDGTFVPVVTFNNSTSEVEHVSCSFYDYTGNGHRIAFRNVLGGGASFTYSYNYIDDITLSTIFVIDEKSCPGSELVTDIEGNVYSTVQIGNQCWMRENLRTTKEADGTPILISGEALSYDEPYYYDYNSSGIPLEERGYLYNWPAAMVACPTGWHLPSDEEWTTLTNYVGSQSEYICGNETSNIAKALASTTGWYYYANECGSCAVATNQSANNASGFGTVPAGFLNADVEGGSDAGAAAYFWSSTQASSHTAYFRLLYYFDAGVSRYNYYGKDSGFSVRCLRD